MASPPNDIPDPSNGPEGQDNLPALVTDATRTASHGAMIYKPGQGYWVRVLTAVAILGLVLSGAAWLWKQVEALPVPLVAHTLTINEPADRVQPGAAVALLSSPAGRNATPETSQKIGSATVARVVGSGDKRSVIEVTGLALDPGHRLAEVVAARVGPEESGAFFQIGSTTGVPKFQIVWVQAAVAGSAALAGLLFIYWLVGRRQRSVDFLIATDAEMKKVNWSTRKNIIDSTIVVVSACFLIAGFLFIIDLLFKTIFQAIGVLESI